MVLWNVRLSLKFGSKVLFNVGVPKHAIKVAQRACKDAALLGYAKKVVVGIENVVDDPEKFESDSIFGDLVKAMLRSNYAEREIPVPYYQWGADLDECLW